MSDLRFALRQLAKSPGFALVVILSLALGIGANATVLCWLQHLVLRPLPGVSASSELVVLTSSQGGGCVSLPDLEDFGRLDRIFSGLAASQITSVALTVDRGVQWHNAQVVSANYFATLGVTPVLGRTFDPEDDRKPSGNPLLVISERLWRSRFGADPAVLGRTVELNGYAFNIIGVVPANFHGSMAASTYDLWAPTSMVWEVRNMTNQTARNARSWHTIGRLQPGVSLAHAQAAVDGINAELTAANPGTNRDVSHRVLDLAHCPWGSQTVMGPGLRMLLAMCGGLLLIVAANVANLLLARTGARQKEIAIRIAAGASRQRIVRQLLVESMLLAAAGGALGLALATWSVELLPLFLPHTLASRVHLEFTLDGMTVALTAALSVVTALLFGLAPALQFSRPNLYEALKEGGRTGRSMTHPRLRHALVAGEIALASVLLIGAALCLQGFLRARQTPFGFTPDRVAVGTLQIGMNGHTKETGPDFYRRLRSHLATQPGIEEAALASWFPLGLQGCKGSGVTVDGYLRPRGEDTTYEYAIISPRYFATLHIPLVEGRDFTDADDGTNPVAIVNEHFAQRFWPGRSAIGQKFRAFGQWRTVVAVAKAGKYNRLNEGPWCFYYLPYQAGVPDLDLNVCVRASGAAESTYATLRSALHALDPRVEFLALFSLADYTQAALIAEKLISAMLLILSAAAIGLAAIGVYGVMAYLVSQRTQEFGIRIALGARPRDVQWQVVRHGLLTAGTGAVAGWLLALGATRMLSAFLHGLSPFDPVIYAAVAALLLLLAVAACYWPARRATQVDPIVALRAD